MKAAKRIITSKSIAFSSKNILRSGSAATILLIILLAFVAIAVSRTPVSRAGNASITKARLGSDISINAAGRGKPWINMTDGHDLVTAYDGADGQMGALAKSDAQPVSLAAADFDEDGMPDLVTGYALPRGGVLTLHRGNVDSVYPTTDAARRRKAEGTFSDVPFLSPGHTVDVDLAPDFIVTGDFDADGHQDIVLASREDSSLFFMAGDGTGKFKSTEAIVLAGRITALASGDVNRRDGLSDLAVAVDAADSPKLLVFEGSRGAVKSIPESFELPAPANAINIANLNDAPEAVISVAAGSDLLLIHGRDRKLFLDEQSRRDVPNAEIVSRHFDSKIMSLASGDFIGDLDLDLGVSFEDGSVQLVSEAPTRGSITQTARSRHDVVIESLASNPGSGGGKLFGARLSSLSHETLVMADRTNREMHVWIDDADRRSRNDPTLTAAIGEREKPVTLNVDDEPVAVLPMRLNIDGISDLVVLRKGHSAPGILVSISSVKGVCNMSDCGSIGCGSLRAAILDANSSPGADMIVFDSGTFDQIPTVTISTPLPAFTEAVTIDAGQAANVCGSAAVSGDPAPADFSPQALVKVQVMSNNNVSDAVTVGTSGCVVRNFVVNRVGNGVHVSGGSQSIVERNFIGVNTGGSAVSQNSNKGVFIDNSARNTIGGSGQAANVISGNLLGIDINGANANDNVVRFNNIGASASGLTAFGNRTNGVRITNGASRNRIGGSVSGGVDNLVYGSANDGVSILSGTANLVQGNWFQINNGNGIGILSSSNTVGGSGLSLLNFIWSSALNGVEISGAATLSNVVQGNRIGMDFDQSGNPIDFTGAAFRHNLGHGIAITNNALSNAIGASTDVNAANFIAFNLGDGVSVVSGTGNSIQINSIFSNVGLGIDLGNDGRDINDDKDPDAGANGKQNYPVLVAANITIASAKPLAEVSPASTVSITVTLNSTPSQNFDVKFYHCSNPCSASGDQFAGCIPRFLGTRTVTTGADGNVSQEFSFDLGSGVSTGFLNATAMNTATGNTSEFSTCAQIGTCSFTISAPTALVGAAAGNGSFTLTTQTGCAWTATSNAAFLTTTSSGTGNGTINYSFTQNSGVAARVGTITVGGKTHIVTQTGAAAGPAITDACRGEGKQLVINGSGFIEGGKVFLNGEQEKTLFVSSTQIIAKKAGKRAATGDTLQVRNPDATQTQVFAYTKNSCFVQ